VSVRVVLWRPNRRPGRWRVDIRFKKPDGTKVRNQVVYEAPTRRMAERWGEAREAQLRTGTLTLEKRTSPRFETFVREEWLPTYPKAAGNKPSTVREKKSHVDRHLVPFFGDMRLDEIDNRAVEQFIATMLRKTKGKVQKERTSRNGYLAEPKPLSPKRVKNVIGTLHTILAKAVDWGVLERLPKFPKVKCGKPSFNFYDTAEIALLLRAARDDDRVLIQFAAYTGARAGELLALEWSDVDLRRRLVTFRRSRTGGITTGTKSEAPRQVPINRALGRTLEAHRHVRGSLVFCQQDGSHLTLWHLHGALARAARRARLQQLRWHDLRHSFASNLAIAGTPLKQIQEWMGHATIAMTERYAHLAPNGGRHYVDALDANPVREAQIHSAAHRTA
jgi:integrase